MTRTAQIITTQLGMVEVEVHGTGTPVLIVHGSPGGVDGAQMMGHFLPRTASAPSRCPAPATSAHRLMNLTPPLITKQTSSLLCATPWGWTVPACSPGQAAALPPTGSPSVTPTE